MPSDTSMPPSDANEPMPQDMPNAGMPPEGAPADGGDGSVMIQVPKSVFDQIHQVVLGLAQTLEAAMQEVGKQKSATEAPSAPAAGPTAPPAGPSGPAMSPDDEDLANFAQELNKKSNIR
jgi:hypothetical protein